MADSFLERNGVMITVIVAVAIGAATCFVTWYITYRNRTIKTLDYYTISDVAIISGDNRPDRLKIMLGTMEVQNPFVTDLLFCNTGKQVIEEDDFLEAIEIRRAGTKIIDWSAIKQSERGLVKNISLISPLPGDEVFDDFISIDPNTLNPGDRFMIQIIYDGDPKKPLAVTTRVKGQTRKLKALQPPPQGNIALINVVGMVGATLMPTGYVIAAIILFDRGGFSQSPTLVILTIYSALGAMLSGWLFFRDAWRLRHTGLNDAG